MAWSGSHPAGGGEEEGAATGGHSTVHTKPWGQEERRRGVSAGVSLELISVGGPGFVDL